MERRNLRVFRVANGLTQKEMAERLGMTRSHYSLVETGKCGTSLKFIKKFQKEFNLPDEEIYPTLKITN